MPTTRQRILKWIGESSFWRRVGGFHTRLYRFSGGRFGHTTGPIKNLLLMTRGRHTGKLRAAPLAYMIDGSRYIVVASNGGADRYPAWWLNLEADPNAQVQIESLKLDVLARTANPAEREALWPRLVAMNPYYGEYAGITKRQIPVVILEPKAPR
jgi:F420H(2)-dependent quinone reductase